MCRRLTFCLVTVLLLAGVVQAEGVKLQVALGTEPKMLDLVSEFTIPFPDISVEVLVAYGDNYDKLAVHAAGGVLPDIILSYSATPIRAIQAGLFMNLQPLVQMDDMQSLIKDFIPGTIDTVTFEGGVYGFPYYSSASAMWLNMDKFDSSGLAAPSRTWTWANLSNVAARLTRRGSDGNVEQVGLNLLRSWGQIMPFFWQAGAEAHPKGDFSTVTLDSEQAIQALEFLQEMAKHGVVEYKDWQAFKRGTAAMFNSGSWELRAWDDSFRYGVTSLPTGPAGRATFTNTDIVAINANTKSPDAAWQFMKWFYSREIQEKLTLFFGLQPARMSLGRYWARSLLEANPTKSVSGVNVFAEDAIFARPQPFYSDPAVINATIRPAMEQVLDGAPARPTMEEMCRVATAALQQAKK